jgi:hypothetical protein
VRRWQGSRTSLPSQITTSPSLEIEGRNLLTYFAVDSHLQLQALVFLVVDGFGYKINP